MDVYDAYGVKTAIVAHGLSFGGFKYYTHHYALKAYDQHFIPVWFMLFFGLVYFFDSSPYVLGALSFALAASLLTLFYTLIRHFYPRSPKASIYGLLAITLFSGTPFFLEMIAWKWETGLLLSLVCFCTALLIAVKNLSGWRWQIMYVVALLVSFWTFGTTWTGAWGIATFLLLRTRTVKSERFIITVVTACIGTILAITMNGQQVQLNIPFLLWQFPTFVVLITTNILLSLGGALRYDTADHIHLSTVLGLTMLTLFFYHYGRLFWQNKMKEKDMVVVGLALVYFMLIALSLFRLVPVTGLAPTSSPINYLFGGRYLFIFSIPFYLALSVGLGSFVLRLSRPVLAILLVAALTLSISVEAVFPHLDPGIADTNRTIFHNLTLPAMKDAAEKHLALPNITGDIYFHGLQTPLSEAVDMRKSAPNYQLDFRSPKSLSVTQCDALHKDTLMTRWLNLYNTDWCR